MRQVDFEAFEKVKRALLKCLATSTTLTGLKIAPVRPGNDDLESAATIALMSLCKDWVRPNTVQFNVGNGKFL